VMCLISFHQRGGKWYYSTAGIRIAASITVLLMSSCMCAGTVGPLPDQGKEQRMERNETGTGQSRETEG